MSLFLGRGRMPSGKRPSCSHAAASAALLRAAMPAALGLARSLLRLRAFREYGLEGSSGPDPAALEEAAAAARESALVAALAPLRDAPRGRELCTFLMGMAVRDAAADLHWLPGASRAVHELSRADWDHLLREPS